jgi:rSAM/selenodomain-associated transferase 2
VRDTSDAADGIVVVDGGSRDATCALAAAHGARVLATDAGRGRQLALGARHADADLLLFLHADARVGPGALAAVRAAFADPRVVATGMRQRIDAAGWFYRAVERAADLRVRRGWVYGDSGLAVQREAYDAAGGFADLPLFEDVDLSRRLRRLGRIALVRDAELLVSARRWREEGRVTRTLGNWWLTAAWLLGVPPERLAPFYHVRRTRRSAGARGSAPRRTA